ncbi:ABC transporter ATP-binding protein, partial [Escherichia coli]|uniref:ABC transporter ATP-binding protein n=1 Tax=Escherichia coli TaxID=562 RepID=UPI0022829FC9
MSDAIIRLQDVNKWYGQFHVLRNINLDVAPGERIVVCGPSGSGKTTCLRLIAGFEQLTSGSIRIHGQEAANLPPYQRDVNTVFQDYALFPHMSVLENVAFGLRMQKVPAAELTPRVEEALRMVQLDDFA